MSIKASLVEDEEEDFFAMLDEESSVPKLLSHPPVVNDATHPSVPHAPETHPSMKWPLESAALIQDNSAIHHSLVSESDNELGDAPVPDHVPGTISSFEDVLANFYSQYNIANMDKVSYLAEKFDTRRWELWEQLSIKYKLSPRESRLLWIQFNLKHEGAAECSRKLFSLTRCYYVDDDQPGSRSSIWRQLLIPDLSDDKTGAYIKYTEELQGIANGAHEDDIVRDVHRTHQELSFFQQAETKQVMTRILSIYSQLNGVKYVQGMNEILGIILYVVRDESDSFWAFTTLMNQLKDLFMAEADSTNEGIYSKIDSLSSLLRQYDYKLWKRFSEIDFPMATLAMRWMTTLLVMDVHLPDAMRLWDIALQASQSNQMLTFSLCISVAYLLCISEHALRLSDVQDTVEVCAHFGRGPEVDVQNIIGNALSVYAFESILRGRYTPTSEEPVLDALADVVDTVRMKMSEVVTSEHMMKKREELTDKVNQARTAVTSWLGAFVTKLPSSAALPHLSSARNNTESSETPALHTEEVVEDTSKGAEI